MIGELQNSFDGKYELVLCKKLAKTLKDDTHPLYNVFKDATSERSGRMILPYAKTNRHKLSFVPQAMKRFNGDFER